MRNYSKTIVALAAASALAAGNASAMDLEYNLHTGYTSEYIFRGINFGQDLVEAGADAATEWNGIGLSAGAWYGSFDSAEDSLNELDLYAEASKDLGFMTAAVGYIKYINSDENGITVDDAQEVYFSLGRDLGFVNVGLTYFWDIETDNDGYSELTLDKSFELSGCLTLNVGATLGYLAEHGQLSHTSAKVSLDYGFTETATVSPFALASWSLNNDNDTIYADTDNELVGGVMLSVDF